MAWIHPDAVEYRRKQFTRHDAHRYIRPNPERWLSPEELRLLRLEQGEDRKTSTAAVRPQSLVLADTRRRAERGSTPGARHDQ
ncbi:MAG: hypothetical protein ACRECO_13785 [Xanthobacteraceae bacterium]